MSQNLSSAAVVIGALWLKVNLATNTPLLPKPSYTGKHCTWMPCFRPIKFVLSYFLRSPSDQFCQIIMKTDLTNCLPLIRFSFHDLFHIHTYHSKLHMYIYCKTSVKGHSQKKKKKIGFQDQLSLNAGQKYCRMQSILQYF